MCFQVIYHSIIVQNILRILFKYHNDHAHTAQFGAWSTGPQHGFARISRWELKKPPERLPTGDVEAIFQLLDNEFTRSMWNYP